MRLLLDTHAFLWFIGDSPELSGFARGIIEDEENELFLSAASLWEMAIKYSIGKLQLPDTQQPFDEQLMEQLLLNQIAMFPIEPQHICRIASMPLHHRDPFDRLIVSQCLHENMPLVSADAVLDAYAIKRLW